MNVGGTTANLRIGNKRNKFKGMSQAEIDKITAEHLDRVTRRIIRNLKGRDFSTSTVSNLAVALGICVDKSRLLRGSSTVNVAVSGRVDALVRVQALAERLQGALGSSPATPIPALDNASSQLARCETVEAEVVESAEPVPAPVKRQRGRPRKVKALPTP